MYAAIAAALFLGGFLYAFWRVGKSWPGVPPATDGIFHLKQVMCHPDQQSLPVRPACECSVPLLLWQSLALLISARCSHPACVTCGTAWVQSYVKHPCCGVPCGLTNFA